MSHRKSILYHLRVLDSEECNDTLDDYDCWFEIIFWEGWESKTNKFFRKSQVSDLEAFFYIWNI